MKKRVLVFPCGSEIGLEVYRSVSFSTHFKLYGGSSVKDHGRFVYENYIDNLPHIDDDNFAQKINEIIKKYKIDFIFPAHDSVVLKIAQLKANSKVDCEVITSPVETCEIARSKLKTYETFAGIIPTPKVFKNPVEIETADLPVFLKPEVGQGSKGTYLAKSYEDIKFYTTKDISLLALEYLPGKEYTVDCFTKRDGELVFCLGRERTRISNGISVNSTEVDDPRFKEIALTINRTLKFRGVWFFQVKENTKGDLVLMEIAPRIAGTMGLTRCAGVNLALLSLFDACGYNVEVSKNSYYIEIDRALQNKYILDIAYKHVYLDFDDLVIFENKINPIVISFIFQCINENVKIHLITKHKEDLHQTLKKYRLSNLFDELIWLGEEEKKFKYIKHKDAIFIDDSYAERIMVKKEIGIPVFDAHNIEALLH